MTTTALGAIRPVGEAAAREPSRPFLCPACGQPQLLPVFNAAEVARCAACAWATDDLLSLVPTQAAGLGDVVLGQGVTALVRASVFLGACVALVALTLVGR